jgi:hypothetical protein
VHRKLSALTDLAAADAAACTRSCCRGYHVLVAVRGQVVLIGADSEQRRDARAVQRRGSAVETAAPRQNRESSASGSTGENTAPSDEREERGSRTGDIWFVTS